MKAIESLPTSAFTLIPPDSGILSAFPVTNLLDSHPKKRFLVDESLNTVTFSLQIDGYCDAIGLANVSADRVVVSIERLNKVDWEDGSSFEAGSSWAGSLFSPAVYFSSEDFLVSKSVWIEIPPALGLLVSITLEKSNTTQELILTDSDILYDSDTLADETVIWNTTDVVNLGAGVLVAGRVVDAGVNPMKGINEELVDLGIEGELANGDYYYYQRDTVRELSIQLPFFCRSNYNQFVLGFLRRLGKNPTMWFISDDLGLEWLMYCRIHTQARSSYTSENLIFLNLTMREVL